MFFSTFPTAVVVLSAFLTLISFAVPAHAQEQRFDGVTLRVATWGGSWRDRVRDLVAADMEQRGAKVDFVVGSPRDNMTKLIAARGQKTPPFDLMEMSDNDTKSMQEGAFLMNINYQDIPNAKSLDPRFRQPQLVSPWMSQDGIVYNVDKFKAAGIPPPERYSDLLNPKLKGWVSFPDITVVHGLKGIIGAAYERGGSESKPESGMEMVKQMNSTLYWKSSVDLLAKFKSGDIWAAPWHAGWAVRGREAGIPLAITYPLIAGKRGILSVTWIGIVKGTQQVKAAEYFINRYLDIEVQQKMGRENGVIPQNPKAAEMFRQDPLLRELMLLSPEQMTKTFYPDFAIIEQSDWSDRWNRIVLQ